MNNQQATRFTQELDQSIDRQLGDHPRHLDLYALVCLLYIAKAIMYLADRIDTMDQHFTLTNP